LKPKSIDSFDNRGFTPTTTFAMNVPEKSMLPLTTGIGSAEKRAVRKLWLRPLLLIVCIVVVAIGISRVTDRFSRRGYQGEPKKGEDIGLGENPSTNETDSAAPTPSPYVAETLSPSSSGTSLPLAVANGQIRLLLFSPVSLRSTFKPYSVLHTW
jgi:hypothetical protein